MLNMVAMEFIDEWEPDGPSTTVVRNGYKVQTTNSTRPSEVPGRSPDENVFVRAEHLETSDRYVVQRTTEYHSGGSTVTVTKQTWEHLSNGVIKVTATIHTNGEETGRWEGEIDAETGECLKGVCSENQYTQKTQHTRRAQGRLSELRRRHHRSTRPRL